MLHRIFGGNMVVVVMFGSNCDFCTNQSFSDKTVSLVMTGKTGRG